MIKIRYGMFETNSSSVHSIVIDVSGTSHVVEDCMKVYGGEYGWGHDVLDTPQERACYLWQGIWTCTPHEQDKPDNLAEWKEKILAWLPNATFVDVDEDERNDIGEDDDNGFHFGWYPGVDHGWELYEMLCEFWEDDELLGAYLTGDNSHVVVSNDNEDELGFFYPDCDYIEYEKGN